jgi:translocation and assembly module TamB
VTTKPAAPSPTAVPSRKKHPVLIALAVIVVVLGAAIGAVCWYATTPQFEAMVRHRLVTTLEKATGGRVEMGAFRWRLMRLEFEADNLTIHGLEAPDEVPYAHIDRLFVRAKIIAFFQAKAGLNLLEGTHPVFHLIVYPDGSTNQPHPKTESKGGSVTDTLFDLEVDRTAITHGLLLLNQQAIPFDLSAKDLGITVTYDAARDHYLANLQAADITAQRAKSPAVHSQLALTADLSRTGAVLSQFRLQTGTSPNEGGILQAAGSIENYADPKFDLKLNGTVDVREVEALTAVPGLEHGTAELQLQGNGTLSRFTVEGKSTITDAAYRTPEVRVSGVNGSALIHITQDELALTALKARLPEGGGIDGELHLTNWLAPTPAEPARREAVKGRAGTVAKKPPNLPVPSASPVTTGRVSARIQGITLRTTLRAVAPQNMDDLGFDTAASGRLAVDWTGNATDAKISANVSLSGGNGAQGVPLSGSVDATYFNRTGAVEIRQFIAQTPGSHIQIQGSLGVYPLSRASSVQVDLTTTNLGEFDKTLAALGVESNGPQGKQKGVQAIPVHLEGQAEFKGTVTGNLLRPDVKGHLAATNFDTVLASTQPPPVIPSAAHPAGAPGVEAAATPPSTAAGAPVQSPAPVTTIHWDSVDAQAEYSPELISIQQATLLRGKTTIHIAGQLNAHQTLHGHNTFDDESAITATVAVQNESIGDLLEIVGSTLPVSGSLNLQAHVGGSLGNLSGGGHLAVQGGAIYGEPYHSLNTDLRFVGQELDATNLKFLQNGGQITADGGYDLHAKTVHFEVKGSGFDLAHFKQIQSDRLALGGKLNFAASASGPVQMPAGQATLHIADLIVNQEFKGTLDGEAKVDHNRLTYEVNSNIDQAHLGLTGHTDLTGNCVTQAKLVAAQLHVDRFFQLLKVKQVTSDSLLTVEANVSGPARQPRLMEGTIDVNTFAVSVGGVGLRSDAPLHASLRAGTLHFDPLKITGDDTNIQAQGAIRIYDTHRDLDLHAKGAVNLKLAQNFDPNITSSGHVDFSVDASGTVQSPSLTGQVKFTNVAMSLGDLPNGLSQMNGTLVFDQNRLTVQQLTGVTGGGKLQLGGYVTYQQGLYGDLTATAKDIRIRYPPGISSMADAQMRLQGTTSSLLLSGNVLLTRFSISPNLDLAALKASSAGPQTIPDASAPSNHVRLDIHITSAPELNFQNSFAKLAGDVDLRLRGTIASPSLFGHITITEGSANFAGTTYQLQRGDIYFSNPIHIDPVIDLDVTARVQDYDIGIGLHGTLSKLNLTYRSEPPLPEADVFALLALGRTQEEQQIYSQEQQAAGGNTAADALLGGALNATVSSRVEKLFGVGSVKIDPNYLGNLGNSTARITVTEKVGKNMTVTYATNVNSTAEQLIQGQVFITPNVSVVAQRDESGVFSLVLKIHQRRR